jgi:hypothetical protein
MREEWKRCNIPTLQLILPSNPLRGGFGRERNERERERERESDSE